MALAGAEASTARAQRKRRVRIRRNRYDRVPTRLTSQRRLHVGLREAPIASARQPNRIGALLLSVVDTPVSLAICYHRPEPEAAAALTVTRRPASPGSGATGRPGRPRTAPPRAGCPPLPGAPPR